MSGDPSSDRRHTIPVPDGEVPRLDMLIAARLDLSRNQAATLIANGHVRVDERREKASYRARPGEVVIVELPPPPTRAVLGESIPIAVMYEDDDLVVVNKAAGMVVHPAPGNWTGTLVNALRGRGGELSEAGGEARAGIVHRLDKDTSGLMLVAKTDRSHRILSAAIAARRVVRRYAALAWGHLDSDTISVDKPIGRDPRDRTRMAIVHSGRTARTDIRRLARFDAADLLRAHLHTGRTHQIRVHLASMGHPVVGDDAYGGGGGRRLVGLGSRRHFLHAAWLVFHHPATGAMMDVRAPLPADLRASLDVVAGPYAGYADTDPLEHFGFYTLDT